LRAGERLSVRAEPDNPVNPRALQVATLDGEVVLGWVPDLLLEFVHLLRESGPVAITVLHASRRDQPQHLSLIVHIQGVGAASYRGFSGAAWAAIAQGGRARATRRIVGAPASALQARAAHARLAVSSAGTEAPTFQEPRQTPAEMLVPGSPRSHALWAWTAPTALSRFRRPVSRRNCRTSRPGRSCYPRATYSGVSRSFGGSSGQWQR
jgi:hypothetical protein